MAADHWDSSTAFQAVETARDRREPFPAKLTLFQIIVLKLLTSIHSPWPEHNLMAYLASREPGKCGFLVQKISTQIKFKFIYSERKGGNHLKYFLSLKPLHTTKCNQAVPSNFLKKDTQMIYF